MALDLGNLMLQLRPAQHIDLGNGGGGMERERLRLMREQFEETKRQNARDSELRDLEIKGREAVARLQIQKEKEKAAAKEQATLLAQKQAAGMKAAEYGGAGNAEGLEAMVPYMSSLGMGADYLGSPGGLPAYRITPDAGADAQTESARAAQTSPFGPGETSEESLSRMGGYPSDERGSLGDPVGITSSGDLDSRGRSVVDRLAASYGEPGDKTPTAAPDPEDFTGAVPKNVIDMGAIQAQTLARLDPVMAGLAGAYPESHRWSAEKTVAGLRSSGLPLQKQLEAFNSARSGPDKALDTGLVAGAQKDKFRETRDELTPLEQERLKSTAVTRANGSYKNNAVPSSISSMEAADTIAAILENDDSRDDGKAVNYLMKLTENKGPQTEQDARRVVGADEASSIEQFSDWLHKRAVGGFSADLRESLLGFVETIRDQDRRKVFGWLDNVNGQIDNPKNHEQVRAGYTEFRDLNVPAWLRDQYAEERALRKEQPDEADGAAGKTSARGTTPDYRSDYQNMGDFDLELEGQALEAGLDPAAMRAVIGPESGGRGDAVNAQSGATGILQFMPAVAKGLGTSVEELAKMPPAEQLPYAIQYLKERGIDEDSRPEDYAMAVAAPNFIGKSDDTVVYPKGSKAWEQNAPWRPKDGGDITVGSILAFYGQRGGGKSKPAEPESDVDAEVLGILGAN